MMERGNEYKGVVVQNYASQEDAITAIRALQAAGFDANHVSVIAQDKGVARDVAEVTDTEAAEGAMTGAVAGGAAGAIAAIIAGASAIAIPGIGIAIGGPIAAAIAGAAGGGLLGGLLGLGIPESEARVHEENFKRGDVLISVVAGDREQEARNILTDVSVSDSGTAGIYNPGTTSTGNTILDQGTGANWGVTPPIDTVIGEREGEGYTRGDDVNVVTDTTTSPRAVGRGTTNGERLVTDGESNADVEIIDQTSGELGELDARVIRGDRGTGTQSS